ncbi:MAG TPA: sigma-70 family RNA polymerase sigma factor [Pirellulales bacterium]|jgi:RNA polymerase sigma-70 factor (ECF subfamily)|nr:sigma-70 family RNA polymerase sigma factor [Pirellulales bacterium]
MRSTIEHSESKKDSRTDEALLSAYCRNGDAGAFAELVQRYEGELYNYLRRYLGDAALAEDAFQATFLQVHLKCEQFTADRRFRPWVYTIATHQAIDTQRRNKRHRAASLDRRTSQHEGNDLGALIELLSTKEPGPVAQLDDVERRDWIRQQVDRLPEGLRAALAMVYYQGMKYREVAEVLSIPVGTVKSRVHSAVLKLNEAWMDAHPPDLDN